MRKAAYCDGNTLMWLSRGELKVETESEIIAAKSGVTKQTLCRKYENRNR